MVGWRPSRGILVALVALVAGYVLCQVPATRELVVRHLVLVPSRLPRNPWTLFTTAFVHPSFGALLSTGLALWFFGSPAELTLGTRRTIVVLVVATLAGSVASALLALRFAPNALLPGAGPASLAAIAMFGAVYGATPIRPFGLGTMKASTCALAFLGISGLFYLMSADLLGLAGGAAGAGVGALSTIKLDHDFLKQPLARFRRWRIRRRYRVIPGGRDSRRYLN